MNGFKRVIYEKKDNVAWITLNNPDRYNALDYEMRRELKEALEDAGKDENIRAVVINGSGKAFSAGADIKAFFEWTPIKVMEVFKEV